jgi:hypothetical protein
MYFTGRLRIIELARTRNCLHSSIRLKNCRPPYNSSWPLENPLDSEVSALGFKCSSSMFQDDFVKYTMKSVHGWSPTPLCAPNPETQGQVLDRLCDSLTEDSKRLFFEAVEVNINYEQIRLKEVALTSSEDSSRLDVDKAWQEFHDSLDESTRESFRWARWFWRNRNATASFSRAWARRWMYKHVV